MDISKSSEARPGYKRQLEGEEAEAYLLGYQQAIEDISDGHKTVFLLLRNDTAEAIFLSKINAEEYAKAKGYDIKEIPLNPKLEKIYRVLIEPVLGDIRMRVEPFGYNGHTLNLNRLNSLNNGFWYMLVEATGESEAKSRVAMMFRDLVTVFVEGLKNAG